MDKKALGCFKDQLGFARGRGAFKDCSFYPCHAMPEGENLDCTFCYCPFYPCGGKIGTGAWYKGVWDCSSCGFIHRGEIVSRIFELIYDNKKISKIKKTIRKEFCR